VGRASPITSPGAWTCVRAEHDPAPRDAGEHRRPPTFARQDHACEAHPYIDMPQWRLMENLRRAEEHVVVGAKNVARQRDIIAELERNGQDTTQALALLAHFEQLQAMHIADRDRLLEELHERI
jgi:hypothetical protein